MLSRSALQASMRHKNASGNNLKAEIEDLATTGVMHPLMKDWPTEVRELANDSAHPKPNAPPTEPQDSRDREVFGFPAAVPLRSAEGHKQLPKAASGELRPYLARYSIVL